MQWLLCHALGFFHVDRQGALMYPQQRSSNVADSPTEIERIRFLRALWVIRAIGGPKDGTDSNP